MNRITPNTLIEFIPAAAAGGVADRARRAPRPSRRKFIQSLGAGLLIAVTAPAFGQVGESGVQNAPAARGRGGRGARGGRGGGANIAVSSRIHIGADGAVTVLTGKVEGGQGSRAEITLAAAEELRLPPDRITLIMADTQLCPDDGPSFGSQTTPRTIPSVRQGAATARQILIGLAAAKWTVAPDSLHAQDGAIVHSASGRSITFGELVGSDSAAAFSHAPAGAVQITEVKEWTVLGKPALRPDRRDLVTGAHQYPSDIVRPGMLYGKVLRPPSYGATLEAIDLTPARAMNGVVVVREGDFVAVAAPTNFAARQAIDALAANAKWHEVPQVASTELYEYLLSNAQGGRPVNPFSADLSRASKSLKQVYHVPYVQHCPMEPRAAVAEWAGQTLTVWTATQNPWGVRSELQSALGTSAETTRVIVPDFGGAFGGKHTGETAIEAARLARAAAKPVWLRWSREEEFTWAYFRPAAVILAEAGIDSAGKLSSWFFININSGPSGVDTPYRVAQNHSQYVASQSPLRQGSYRGLAITANNFARESFMDELAATAGVDPLEFRLSHIGDARLKAVLQDVARRSDFASQHAKSGGGSGIGIACGTEKGSYVATAAAVSVDPQTRTISVKKVWQTFECGAILNPAGLLQQVQGAIVMGIGPALREEIQFEKGQISNGNFADYQVPRFADLPQLDVNLLDRPDVASASAGETPIMSIAPAINNAVFNATGVRGRKMPVKV